MTQSTSPNLNTARSEETRQKLIAATVSSLVEIGFSRTTGVEVCRRAGVTRGALNHHFPAFVDLLVCALQDVYASINPDVPENRIQSMVQFVQLSYQRVIRPEYKAVIELWLASQNEPDIGADLGLAIRESFSKMMSGNPFNRRDTSPGTEALFMTLFELLIAIGLGRATSGGNKSPHEDMVYQTMIELAEENDRKRNTP